MTAGTPDLSRPNSLGQPDLPPRPAGFFHRREPDAVRACALGLAVELSGSFHVMTTPPEGLAAAVVEVAEVFEAYLTGEGEQP